MDVDIEVQNQALALDGLEFGCLDGLDISPWNRTTMPRDIWPPLREPAYNTEPSRSEFGWNRVFPPPTARTPSLALVKNKSYCLSRGTEGTPGASRRQPRCRFLPPLPPLHPLASPAILPVLSWRCRGTAEAPAEAPAPLPISRGKHASRWGQASRRASGAPERARGASCERAAIGFCWDF